jgi:hypothetical protein
MAIHCPRCNEIIEYTRKFSHRCKCVICKERFKGFGNNAYPIKEGKCCDKCNIDVIKARLTDIIPTKPLSTIVEGVKRGIPILKPHITANSQEKSSMQTKHLVGNSIPVISTHPDIHSPCQGGDKKRRAK